MQTLIYIAEPNPLVGNTLRDQLGEEMDFLTRHFATVDELRKACQARPPHAILASCRTVLSDVLPFLQDLDASLVSMAMTDVEVTVVEEVVAIQEDHHHKEVGVVEEENLVVILVGVK